MEKLDKLNEYQNENYTLGREVERLEHELNIYKRALKYAVFEADFRKHGYQTSNTECLDRINDLEKRYLQQAEEELDDN